MGRSIVADSRPAAISIGRRRFCQILSALWIGIPSLILSGCSAAPSRDSGERSRGTLRDRGNGRGGMAGQ